MTGMCSWWWRYNSCQRIWLFSSFHQKIHICWRGNLCSFIHRCRCKVASMLTLELRILVVLLSNICHDRRRRSIYFTYLCHHYLLSSICIPCIQHWLKSHSFLCIMIFLPFSFSLSSGTWCKLYLDQKISQVITESFNRRFGIKLKPSDVSAYCCSNETWH